MVYASRCVVVVSFRGSSCANGFRVTSTDVAISLSQLILAQDVGMSLRQISVYFVSSASNPDIPILSQYCLAEVREREVVAVFPYLQRICAQCRGERHGVEAHSKTQHL